MKNGIITAKAAAKLSKDAKASRLIILAVDNDGNFAFATAGKPGGDDLAAMNWANDHARYCAMGLAEAIAPSEVDDPT